MAYRSIPNPFRLACEAMEAYPAEVARVAGVPYRWVKSAYYHGTVPFVEAARPRIAEALRKINKRREEDGRPHMADPSTLTEARLFPPKQPSGRPVKSYVFNS
jgi:hypothetical protein